MVVASRILNGTICRLNSTFHHYILVSILDSSQNVKTYRKWKAQKFRKQLGLLDGLNHEFQQHLFFISTFKTFQLLQTILIYIDFHSYFIFLDFFYT